MAFNFIFTDLVLLIKQIHLISLQPQRPWPKKSQTEGYYAQQEGKNGNGGHMAHFFVAVACNNGLILSKQYHGRLTGEGFAEFFRSYFPRTFERSKYPHEKLFFVRWWFSSSVPMC